MLSFAQWLQATEFCTALRGSAYVYPIILSLHMVAIALFGGLILMTDLRLLGVVLRHRSIAEVINGLRRLKRMGFVVMITCGLLLFSGKAEEYYYNAFFHVKVGLLLLIGVHALVFHKSVYGNAVELDRRAEIPGVAKLAAVTSLLLWLGLVICGRGIGYIEPPLDKIHAEVRDASSLLAQK